MMHTPMRTPGFFAVVALVSLSLGVVGSFAARQTSKPSAASQTQAQTPGSPDGQPPSLNESGYVLKVKTKLVTLDVIATDSKGNIVRDLKPEELQVTEKSAPQKIAAFEFMDRAALAASAPAPATPSSANGISSNMVRFEGLTIPPTVLLMDALNTSFQDRPYARMQMLRLLKTLPQNTPVAVFLLGGSMRVVQGFSSDPTVLQTAVNQILQSGQRIEQNPADDPNSVSNTLLDGGSGATGAVIGDIQDFEKEDYANSMDFRVRQTLASLKEIARYLSGIPGRKNLLWFSESFPFALEPDTTTGNDPFQGVRSYSLQITDAADALSDAQVAIYPVFAGGLQTDQSTSASQQPPTQALRRPAPPPPPPSRGGRGAPPPPPPRAPAPPPNWATAALNREQQQRIQLAATMNELADDTGGKTCFGTNDLSGCVTTALKDGTSYYEVAFYPQNTVWDGTFHAVSVKTSRKGVKLTYRKGYFALDADALTKDLNPDQRLREACTNILPSTSIHLMAQPIPADTPASTAGQPAPLKYLLIIDPLGVSFPPSGDAFNVNLQEATCEFKGPAGKFALFKQSLTRSVTNQDLQVWLEHGIPDYITMDANAKDQRVRFAVVDTVTGLTGAVDVIGQPADVVGAEESSAPPPPQPPPPPVAPMVVKTTPILAIPDLDPPGAAPKASDHLTFRAPTGQAGTLT